MSPLARLAASMLVATGLASAHVSPVSVQEAQRPAGSDQYLRTVEAWRARHEADLKADDGWLTLVELYCLQKGANRVGSDLMSEVRLPRGTREVGTIYYRPAKVDPSALSALVQAAAGLNKASAKGRPSGAA